jgi:hypothetical protein
VLFLFYKLSVADAEAIIGSVRPERTIFQRLIERLSDDTVGEPLGFLD